MLRRLDLEAHLEFLAFSDEVGVPKPNPGIFAKALAELGSKPEESVHVGDLKRTDVQGARALGMGTVRVRGTHDDRADLPEADAVVEVLPELLPLIGLPALQT